MKNYIDIIKTKTSITPNTILEIGSRDGNDANTLKTEFNIKDKNVWVVEPNPKQQRVISATYPNFNLVKNAVFNEEKELTFNAVYDENYNGVSSLLQRADNLYQTINSELITVNAITGKSLLESINKPIDLCKIDVEGVTYEVIQSFKDSVKNIKSFHIESEHQVVWNNQTLYSSISSLLQELKYTCMYFTYVNGVKLQSDSIWVDKNYLINS